uniref:Uncharacterized protein n=1 Tax=viral metagenome TaxID=1070528 RepID=A0A6C0D2D7_9ZZZZ
MDIHSMPEDIIKHIGAFYVTKQIKLLCRLSKIKNKIEELEKRTIDEWIEHLMVSKRYSIKNIEIINDRIHFRNLWGDKCICNKNEIIHQGCISHVRQLHLWYTQRIISAATPAPQYEGEKIRNIVGEHLTAKYVKYGDYYGVRCLVFTH